MSLNEGSTVRVSTMPFQGNEEDVERHGECYVLIFRGCIFVSKLAKKVFLSVGL